MTWHRYIAILSRFQVQTNYFRSDNKKKSLFVTSSIQEIVEKKSHYLKFTGNNKITISKIIHRITVQRHFILLKYENFWCKHTVFNSTAVFHWNSDARNWYFLKEKYRFFTCTPYFRWNTVIFVHILMIFWPWSRKYMFWCILPLDLSLCLSRIIYKMLCCVKYKNK